MPSPSAFLFPFFHRNYFTFTFSRLFSENGFCIKDPSKKYAGQTLTPRHTIDAILGLNKLGGKYLFFGKNLLIRVLFRKIY